MAGTGQPRKKRNAVRDLTALVVAGALLVAVVVVGFPLLYKAVYSPSAFIQNYLSKLSEGRAADVLQIPGVAVDSAALEAAGIDPNASDALLRQAALAPLTDIEVVTEEEHENHYLVTATYKAGGVAGSTTFKVESAGWQGLAPAWRFAQTPLGEINLTVNGSMTFSINGFTVDKRQVSIDGVDADPAAAVPMLVFAPGLYSVAVNNAVSTAKGTAILSDVPLKPVDVAVDAQPTQQFVDVIQAEVNTFLVDQCASQRVLQPTNCPFGLAVQNRIVGEPTWEITTLPTITVAPLGGDWVIPATDATATITVEMQSVFDGSTWTRTEEVPFRFSGFIRMTEDGQASISISAPDTL